MKKLTVLNAVVLSTALLLFPHAAIAQQDGLQESASRAEATLAANQQNPPSNVPQPVRQAEEAVEDFVDRFGIGVHGGVGLDPELINFGGHATFAPIFSRNLSFRPGIEFGVGEVTTMFGVNLDFIYTLPGATRNTRWTPYVGAGPNFAVSHQGFEATPEDPEDDDRNRFDFSDTDFEGGFNFLVGARSPNVVFFELKATDYGVSTIRLLAGFNF